MIKIAVVPGDGIGPEVIAEAMRALKAALGRNLRKFTFKHYPLLGAKLYLKTGGVFPEKIKKELAQCDAILFGAIGDPRVPAGVLEKGLLLEMRFSYDQYVNLRPVKLLDARVCPLKNKTEKDIDFVVVRENTEGLYADVGGFFKKGTKEEVAQQVEINTYRGVSRIMDYAFKLARKRHKKLLMSDKSNVLTYGHDLWQRVFLEKAKQYPDVETRHMYVDALCMQLVRDPSQFDVIVTNNLFGDIVTDLGAQIQGGMGLASSGNINPNGVSMFEPVHGSAPDIAGRGIANPLAAILTSSMLLDYLNHAKESRGIENAVRAALKENKVTKELGGTLTTKQVGDFVVKQLRG